MRLWKTSSKLQVLNESWKLKVPSEKIESSNQNSSRIWKIFQTSIFIKNIEFNVSKIFKLFQLRFKKPKIVNFSIKFFTNLLSNIFFRVLFPSEFKIENHVKIGPTTFKTQPISEENIQECVNLVVSKYMSPNIPPWQVKIIPMGTEKAFYLMIRIHHLILDEQKNLNVSDMMLLDKSKGMRISPQVSFNDFPLMKSPLTDIIKKPKDALEIYDDFVEFLTDRWNSFVHRHDSLDHHDGLVKKPKGVTELLSSVIMTVFNTQLEYKHCAGKALAKTSDPQLHFRFWMKLMYEEFERRQLSFKVILSVYLNAINPLNIATEIVKLLWWTVITWTFLSPWYIWREVETVHRFVFLNQTVATNTIVGFLINYVPLVAGSVKEFFYFLSIIFNGPRLFFEEAFSSSKKGEISPHCLQSTTLCGRKVVSWSGQISCEELQAKCRRNQQTHSEILLSTVSSCLMNFYSKTSFVPAQVGINFRSIPYKYLFGSKFKRNGVIGMRLPVESTSVNQLVGIRNQIKQAREQQIIVYLLSIIQIKFEFLTTVLPSSWLKILINFLSKKYSITVAEVLGFNKPEPQDYSTTFGGEIVDVLFFRTPQANTSSAITFQRFKNKIRMCLMCDINFLGQQHLISSHFVDAFHQIPVVRQAVK